MGAHTIQLNLPLLISGYGGLNSLSLELYNKPYLDNKLSYYIKGSNMVAILCYILLKLDNKAGVIPKRQKPYLSSRNKALKCRGGEIRTPDLLLPKQAR